MSAREHRCQSSGWRQLEHRAGACDREFGRDCHPCSAGAQGEGRSARSRRGRHLCSAHPRLCRRILRIRNCCKRGACRYRYRVLFGRWAAMAHSRCTQPHNNPAGHARFPGRVARTQVAAGARLAGMDGDGGLGDHRHDADLHADHLPVPVPYVAAGLVCRVSHRPCRDRRRNAAHHGNLVCSNCHRTGAHSSRSRGLGIAAGGIPGIPGHEFRDRLSRRGTTRATEPRPFAISPGARRETGSSR